MVTFAHGQTLVRQKRITMERFFNTAGPATRSWDERIWHRPYDYAGRTIMVWGM